MKERKRCSGLKIKQKIAYFAYIDNCIIKENVCSFLGEIFTKHFANFDSYLHIYFCMSYSLRKYDISSMLGELKALHYSQASRAG